MLATVSPLLALAVSGPAAADVASSANFSLESVRFVAAAGSSSSPNFEVDVIATTTPVGEAASTSFSLEPIPLPEPSSLTMLTFGASMLALLTLRRRRAGPRP
jgi:hypothetical protein